MWHRWRYHGRHGYGFRGFGGGVPPFGFWFGMGRPFPRREDYLRMLERYKEDLEAELREINREIEDLRREPARD